MTKRTLSERLFSPITRDLPSEGRLFPKPTDKEIRDAFGLPVESDDKLAARIFKSAKTGAKK